MAVHQEAAMDLTARLILISTLIVTVTDVVEYIYIKQHPEKLTISFLISVIIVTVVPLAINIWFHVRYR
jgi:hypothetical protein